MDNVVCCRGDERRLRTVVGEVSYQLTYYKKAAGGYEYLTDSVLGSGGKQKEHRTENFTISQKTEINERNLENST